MYLDDQLTKLHHINIHGALYTPVDIQGLRGKDEGVAGHIESATGRLEALEPV